MSVQEIPCPTPKAFDKKTLQEGLKYFKDILRIDSRNPNADEIKVIEYIAKILKKEKIPYKIYAQEKKHPNLIARLVANPKAAKKEKAILLTSHVDTVAWRESEWKHHPLAAVEEDGWLFGRGTIDMKNHTIYCLMTLLSLKRRKIPLNRDVVFCCFADEEAGCTHGSSFMTQKHPEVFADVEYALNEVGGFPVYVKEKQFILIQLEEKGFAWYTIEFPGKEGHGSLASKLNSNYPMADFIQKLKNLNTKVKPSKTTQNMIYTISAHLSFLERFIFRSLARPWFNALALKLMPKERRESFYAMTHNTFAPTAIDSSRKVNVVPGMATLAVDNRILPTSSIAENERIIKKMLPENAKITIDVSGEPVAAISGGDFYQKIVDKVKADLPEAVCVPYTLVGISDAGPLSKIGIKTIGFSPIYFDSTVNFTDLYHGHNERILVDGFFWGMDIFYRLVEDIVKPS